MASRRNSRSGPGRKNEINMIPFLDVLLTLLIVFMVATPVVNRSIEVNIPESAVGKVTDNIDAKDLMVVEVHFNHSYSLYFNTDKYTGLTQQQLTNQINEILETGGKEGGKVDPANLVIQVAADKRTEYQSVVAALTLLKQYGFVDVGLITNSEPDN